MLSRAAVFRQPGQPLAIEQFELPERLEPGSALCKVRMSTICGSDLHTIAGRRQEPVPLILGHEILGEIVTLGDPAPHDGSGEPLGVGDRVTWSIMAFCGECFFCKRRLPQKCQRLRKYGHSCCLEWPHLTGGYAEYIYLFPGTAVFRVPECLSDEIATPANCALSTVVNAVETIGLERGETVLVQGAGMLGLNLIALVRQAGAALVIVTDVAPDRLALATRFGADACLDIAHQRPDEVADAIRSLSGGHGVDVAFEVCGNRKAVTEAVGALRIGGRYLIAGLVTSDSDLGLEGSVLARNCLTLKGIHNYRPDHLARALRFLEQHAEEYPYAELVGATFPLSQINDAVRLAASGRHVRVAIR